MLYYCTWTTAITLLTSPHRTNEVMIAQYFYFIKTCEHPPITVTHTLRALHKVQRIQPLTINSRSSPLVIGSYRTFLWRLSHGNICKNISIILCMRQSKPALLFKPEHYTPSEMEKKKQLSGNSNKVNTSAVPKQWEVSKSRWKDVSLTLCCFCLIFHCEAL